MSKAALWAAAAFIAFALAITLYRPANHNSTSAFDRFARGFASPTKQALVSQPPALQPGQMPVAAIPHTAPPDPRVFDNDPARQATYDAAARPGEFVTPPNVSVEH